MGSAVTRPLYDFPREERAGQYVVTRFSITSDGTPAAVTLKTENMRPVRLVEIENGAAYTKPTGDAISFTPPASRTIAVALYS